MAKKKAGSISNDKFTSKKTTIGNGIHSRTSRNKHSTKKKYRGQGK